MKKINKIISSFGLSAFAFASLITLASPVFVSAVPITAASEPEDCSQRFLTFPTWFRGLVEVKEKPSTPGEYECVVVSPDVAGGLSVFIWSIVLNVIEMGLQIVAYLTAFFIFWGGFQYMRSVGDPQVAVQARQTILNAAIGLVISIASIAGVNLVFGIIK